MNREEGTDAFLREIDADGFKYKRFGNVIELQKEVREALVKLLKDMFGVAPTSDENVIAKQTIEATSTFESQPLTRIPWKDLDHKVARQLVAAAENRKADELSSADLLAEAMLRGLVWTFPGSETLRHSRRGRTAGKRPFCGFSPVPGACRHLPGFRT
jgi:predicted HTH transcriptional regulator